jgi:hypothetical protein
VIDAAGRSMVRVDHTRHSLVTVCVGGIDGSTLELWGEVGVAGYTDRAGRSVDDRFTVVEGRRPEGADCDHERYSF